jgi:hypothetical protein
MKTVFNLLHNKLAIINLLDKLAILNLLDKLANVYSTNESGFPLNDKPPNKVSAGFNTRKRVNSDSTKTVLGFDTRISLCVKMADFNPCYNKSNMFILFLYTQTFEVVYLEFHDAYILNFSNLFHPNFKPKSDTPFSQIGSHALFWINTCS